MIASALDLLMLLGISHTYTRKRNRQRNKWDARAQVAAEQDQWVSSLSTAAQTIEQTHQRPMEIAAEPEAIQR